jgi:hypothetical protein
LVSCEIRETFTSGKGLKLLASSAGAGDARLSHEADDVKLHEDSSEDDRREAEASTDTRFQTIRCMAGG